MTAPVRRTTVPSAVGENRERIRTLEFTAPDQRIALREPMLWGAGLGTGVLDTGLTPAPGLRCRGGYAYRLPDDEPYAMNLAAGDFIRVFYTHSGPGYQWMGVRIHVITAQLDRYYAPQPGSSSPFTGGFGTYNGPNRTWAEFSSFMAITDLDGDVVTWDAPVGVEQYAWDVTSVGHIGYAFHDFTGGGSFVGPIPASFSGVSSGYAGAITFWQDGPPSPSVGAVVGEDEAYAGLPGTAPKGLRVELTDDVPAGSLLLIVIASQDWDATEKYSFVPTTENQWDHDLETRPFVLVEKADATLFPAVIPMFYAAGQWWPFDGFPTDHQPFFG